MSVRIFRCRCNHRMRLGASHCGYCFVPTPLWNRWWFGPAVMAAGVALWLLTR